MKKRKNIENFRHRTAPIPLKIPSIDAIKNQLANSFANIK
jgi:hypothetical protein